MKIHHLADDRASIITLFRHSFRFSDGTISEPQDDFIVKTFTLTQSRNLITMVAGMRINKTWMALSPEQLDRLDEIRGDADLVLVPDALLFALREQNVRHMFSNVVGLNATVETQQSPPDKMIVDIENWSY